MGENTQTNKLTHRSTKSQPVLEHSKMRAPFVNTNNTQWPMGLAAQANCFKDQPISKTWANAVFIGKVKPFPFTLWEGICSRSAQNYMLQGEVKEETQNLEITWNHLPSYKTNNKTPKTNAPNNSNTTQKKKKNKKNTTNKHTHKKKNNALNKQKKKPPAWKPLGASCQDASAMPRQEWAKEISSPEHPSRFEETWLCSRSFAKP